MGSEGEMISWTVFKLIRRGGNGQVVKCLDLKEVGLRQIDVMNKDGFKIIWRERKERTGCIMYEFKGVGLREVNVLINYDLMNKVLSLGRRRWGGVTFRS